MVEVSAYITSIAGILVVGSLLNVHSPTIEYIDRMA